MIQPWLVFNLNDRGKSRLILKSSNRGRVLDDSELKDMGVYFDDHKFGGYFYDDSGEQICPSFMGANFTAGLHGYHPSDKFLYKFAGIAN